MRKQILYAPLSETATSIVNKIYVNNIVELYAAINDLANAGKTIVLAPGTYTLNPNYPNGGRLDLLHNMWLQGQPGHAELVIIDVTALPLTSYKLTDTPRTETAPIRMGNGYNVIEWITVQNNIPNNSIKALIQTDINATPTTKIKVVHTILEGSNIGLCIINRYPVNNDRIVEAEIENNDIRNNAVTPANNTVPRFATGIQVQNSHGVTGAVIRATLTGNYVHHNGNGIAVLNGAPRDTTSNENSISIKSNADRFEDNGVGVALIGASSSGAGGTASENSILFEANGTTIRNNQGDPLPQNTYNPGGVYAVAGFVSAAGVPGAVNNNDLNIIFKGCPIDGNIGANQIYAYGAYSLNLSGPAGSNNTNEIHLQGVSKQATDSTIISDPDEIPETNTVNVFR
jgi:hypothetical protein